MLAREPAVCAGLGLAFASVSVPKTGATSEHQAAVMAALATLPPPVLAHCRTGGRVRGLLGLPPATPVP